ncbi:hypothetical protein J3E68DRAFT_391464 [Trichoderma sp. SZMC 28012]
MAPCYSIAPWPTLLFSLSLSLSCSACSNVLCLGRLYRTISYYFRCDALLAGTPGRPIASHRSQEGQSATPNLAVGKEH